MTKSNYFVGIDIGSTAAKVAVLDDCKIVELFTLPTGWNGKETAERIYEMLKEKGYADSMKIVATGYGRVCVDYADRVVTEITCHGKGAWALFDKDAIVVDVGGQDTKIIQVVKGSVEDFLMNDKCAAGTGKFIEIMATRLGVSLEEMYEMAQQGNPLPISSMCTVFAESEVVGHIGAGEKREDIAAGVIDSVATKVANLLQRYGKTGQIALTGGLSLSPYFVKILEEKMGCPVMTDVDARYAGALGAALTAGKRKKIG